MKLRVPFLVALVAAAACGGSTTSSSPPDGGGNQALCAPLLDSGVNCEACLGRQCCSSLVTCGQNGDGLAYVDCVTNCFTSRDAGNGSNCEPSCRAAHPNGASACDAYYQCAAQQCFNNGC
jgi:hypothetical protein